MIENLTQNTRLAETERIANSFFSRLKGLLGTTNLAVGTALVIIPCSSIHTFGMKYPIDVLFIGADNKVLKVVCSLAPGRVSACKNSRYVIELPANTALERKTQVGDEVTIHFS